MRQCIQVCKSLLYHAGTTLEPLRNHLREKWFPTPYGPKGRGYGTILPALLESRRRMQSRYDLPSRRTSNHPSHD
jgi:hypothetical protein